MSLLLLVREILWFCPSCTTEKLTTQANVVAIAGMPAIRSEFHLCPGLGVIAPLVERIRNGQAVRHVVVEREDMIGDEMVRYKNGTMSVRTERADGSNDCTVFAPTVNGKVTA